MKRAPWAILLFIPSQVRWLFSRIGLVDDRTGTRGWNSIDGAFAHMAIRFCMQVATPPHSHLWDQKTWCARSLDSWAGLLPSFHWIAGDPSVIIISTLASLLFTLMSKFIYIIPSFFLIVTGRWRAISSCGRTRSELSLYILYPN